MRQSLDDAYSELKRSDHLIYVSLKYTRTVDVIKSIVERLINCIELLITALVDKSLDEKKIAETPQNVIQKCQKVKEIYHDPMIEEMCNFFLKLRKIDKAQFTRSSEYRRHVTMAVMVDDVVLNIDIDTIKAFYETCKGYFEYVLVLIEGVREE